jgi:hypothetical protein
MIETRKLNIGDLVCTTDGSLGMIERIDEYHINTIYPSFYIRWFADEPDLNLGRSSWKFAQKVRQNYLALRNDLV